MITFYCVLSQRTIKEIGTGEQRQGRYVNRETKEKIKNDEGSESPLLFELACGIKIWLTAMYTTCFGHRSSSYWTRQFKRSGWDRSERRTGLISQWERISQTVYGLL
jgi:hypothetical protein